MAERGELYGLRADGTDTYARVSELMHKHVGALRAWGGRPPVTIKVLIEGQEEVGSPLEEGFPAASPEYFRADAILVADGAVLRTVDGGATGNSDPSARSAALSPQVKERTTNSVPSTETVSPMPPAGSPTVVAFSTTA